MSNASGEFDRKPEKEVPNKTKKAKGKKKSNMNNDDSQDSVIRVGDNNNNTEMMLGEQEEEDAILERELQGLDDQNPGEGSPNDKTTAQNSNKDTKPLNPAPKKPVAF